MLRKVVSAVAVLGLCLGIALADEFRATIIKVDGDKVTFKKGKGGEEMTLPVAANVKVSKGTFNKETEKVEDATPVDGGLKNKMFADIGEKGVGAMIVTDADNKKITEIQVTKGKKKNQ